MDGCWNRISPQAGGTSSFTGSGATTASECASTWEWTGRPSFSSSRTRTSAPNLYSSARPEPHVTEAPSTAISNGLSGSAMTSAPQDVERVIRDDVLGDALRE